MAGVKQAQTMMFSLQSRHILTPDETEIYELMFLAGIVMDPQVFKIILDLLKMNIAPMAIMQMLKSLRSRQRKKGPSSILSTSSNDSGASRPTSSRSDPTARPDHNSRSDNQNRSRPSSTRPDRPPSRSRLTNRNESS